MVLAMVYFCGVSGHNYSVKRPLSKRPKIGFQDQLSLNELHSTLVKLPFIIKIFALSIFTRVLLYLYFVCE